MAENPILHDLRPFTLQYPPSLSPGQRRVIYEGQVRAFLEASEIVEIEEEVLNDILDGFSGIDDASDDTAAGENIAHLQKSGRIVNAAENMELPLPHGFYVFFGPQGMIILRQILVCFSNALNHLLSGLMAPRWAKQQINGMLTHLKQRGEPYHRKAGQR